MNFSKLIEVMRSIESRHRDYVIERLLNDIDDKPLSINDRFVKEVKEHISTVINRNDFINETRFIKPEEFIIEKTCDCKVIIQSSEEFDKNIQTLYFMYRLEPDFNVSGILNDNYIKYLLDND